MVRHRLQSWQEKFYLKKQNNYCWLPRQPTIYSRIKHSYTENLAMQLQLLRVGFCTIIGFENLFLGCFPGSSPSSPRQAIFTFNPILVNRLAAAIVLRIACFSLSHIMMTFRRPSAFNDRNAPSWSSASTVVFPDRCIPNVPMGST